MSRHPSRGGELASPSIGQDLHVPEPVRHAYLQFIEACTDAEAGYRLTPRADGSAYALCFAIFGLGLLRCGDALDRGVPAWDAALRRALDRLRAGRSGGDLRRDKPYLQLLTFTLSALSILGTLERDPLVDHVLPLLPSDVERELQVCGATRGVPRSGNQAMFLGILLLHAQRHLGVDTGDGLERWVRTHLAAMNRHGFWGDARSMSHLQFQNGYHQYELLEYLDAPGVPWQTAADAVASLADDEGHFAPYPGGGGCYDYDAVFLLTTRPELAQRHAALLATTQRSLLNEQNPDGGFGESQRIRPRSLDNLRRAWRHVARASGRARQERLRQALTLLRPHHDRVHTHWSQYSREWGESDLWDSWFRMLTLARIECAFDPSRAAHWGFIDYPGIGFHPSLHSAAA